MPNDPRNPAPAPQDGEMDFGLDLTLPEAAFAPFEGKTFEDLLNERSRKQELRTRGAVASSAYGDVDMDDEDDPKEARAPTRREDGPARSFKRSSKSSTALEALASLSEEEALALARLAKQHPYAVGWAREFDHPGSMTISSGVAAFSAAGFGPGYIDAGLGHQGASLAASGSLGRIERIAAGMESLGAPALAQGAPRQAWLMASPTVAGAYLQPMSKAHHGAILDKSNSKKFADREASLGAKAAKMEATRKAALSKALDGQAAPERKAEAFDPIAAARQALDAAKAKAASVLAQAIPKLRSNLGHAPSPVAAPVEDKRASSAARRRIAASFAALGLPDPDLARVEEAVRARELAQESRQERPQEARRTPEREEPQKAAPAEPARADVKAALLAVERRDAMGLLKALPEGAPWPSAARWPLASYAAYHDWPQGLALIHRRGLDVDSRGADGLRPLDWAVAQKAWRALAQLWRLGAKALSNTPAKPSLMCALIVQEAPLEALEAALAAGADVNAPDALGSRPIHLAAKSGSRALCELLVGAKADLSARDGEERLARDVAKVAKHYELSHYLQREGFRGRSAP